MVHDYSCIYNGRLIGNRICSIYLESHTGTVVRECCKGDDASQWKNPKFDPPPRSNPISDSHKSWQRWLRRGPLHLCKSSSRSAQGFVSAHAWLCAPNRVYSASFFSVFGFLQLATTKAPRSILTQNMPKHAVPRKDVLSSRHESHDTHISSGTLDNFLLMAFHTLSLLHFSLLHFPPLRYARAFSTPAFSTPAFSAPPFQVMRCSKWQWYASTVFRRLILPPLSSCLV